jgi:hypothetical protein
MMELFREIGGWPFIISSFIAIISFVAYTIREKSIRKWEKAQEEKHLLLVQKFTQNENLLSQTVTSLMSITHGSNEIRLSSYQKLWSIMLKIKNEFPSFIAVAYSIHTKDEYKKLLQTDNPLYHDKSSVEDFIKLLGTLSKEAEEYRLAVTINAWNIYWSYQFFFARVAALYSMGIDEGKLIHFLDDDCTKNTLSKIIETDTLSKLTHSDSAAFYNIHSYLEIKLIEQFSGTLSGFSLTKEAIYKALEITRPFIEGNTLG